VNKLTLPLLLISVSLSQLADADIYKWTDKEGKTHYSATPPKDPQAKAEDIEDKIKANIGKVQPASNYQAMSNTNTTNKEKQRSNNTAKSKEDRYKADRSPARIAYCNQLKSNIHTLENSKNIKRVKNGDTKTLNSQQIAAQLKKDKSSLKKNCAGI